MFPAYADVPGYVLVFPILYGALAYFALAIARHLRVFAAARPSNLLASVPRRVGGLVVYALAQVRMFRDARAGLMHFAIFWGFVALTVGTADIATGGLVQAIVGWPLGGATWSLVTALQNVAAVGVLLAIGYAAWRRVVSRPRRLALTRSALVILGLIGGVVGTELAAMGLQAARSGDRAGAVVANALGGPLRGVDPGLLQVAFAAAWWAHVVLVAAFLCYLPGSKHLHMATSFFNVYFRKLAPRGELPAMDLEAEGATFGVRTIADLGWKDLLDGFTCTECGRCTEACPANVTGKSLDPRAMIMGIRHLAVDAERGLNLIPNSPLVRATYGLDDRLAPAALAVPIVDAAIPYDAVWDCVTCGACVEACPVLIEHVDKIVGLRRNLVLEETRFPPELTSAFRNMEQAGNPWGSPRSGRLDWTKDLPFRVPTVAEMALEGTLDSLEVLYWVGCAAAFDDRNRKVARAVATCLSAAAVRFAVLGQEEACTGDPARRLGNEYVFQVLARGNIETLHRYGMEKRTIITACPHCFNTIGTEYGQLGGTFEIVHHAVYLRELMASGRLPLAEDPAPGAPRRPVTLHDSCYLARYSGISAEPRDLLRQLPVIELREMEQRERSSFCCGAGGGRMWMEERRGTRINEERTRQALSTGASAVVTECPFCMTMIRDGLSAAGDRGAEVEAIDLAELLAASLAQTPAAR